MPTSSTIKKKENQKSTFSVLPQKLTAFNQVVIYKSIQCERKSTVLAEEPIMYHQ
jgi:hypothetical protein